MTSAELLMTRLFWDRFEVWTSSALEAHVSKLRLFMVNGTL